MDYKYLHDDELEKKILGAMLINEECAQTGTSLLTEDDFYRANKGHREIMKAILELYNEKSAIDATTVANQLKQNKVFDEIGGVNLIEDLIDEVVVISNFENYCIRLKDFTLLRKILEKCESLVKEGSEKEVTSVTDFLTYVEDNITEITKKRRVSNFESAQTIAEKVHKIVIESSENRGVTGLQTGFSNLDRQINGFGKGQMIVIAARPGVGKSALALNMCYNIARSTKSAIGYFSLEMSNEELMKRLFSVASGIYQDKINKGFLDKNDKLNLKEAQKQIAATNLFFEESTSLTIDDIIAKSKKLKEQRPDLALIVVDHIGIIQEGVQKFKSDQEKIAYYSRKLKTLAMDLDIPVIVVAHINRDAEKKDNRKPELSELRGSGAIENDCDKALLLYRTNYYKNQGIDIKEKNQNNGQDQNQQDQKPEQDEGLRGEKMEIIIAKNRQGANGTISLIFFPRVGRFSVPTDDSIK